MHLIGTSFFEPVLSYIPNPGESPRTQGSVAVTTGHRFILGVFCLACSVGAMINITVARLAKAAFVEK
jgi:hypothetical protein